jgi:glycosyltransferase involved in cell wall biosynthesis
LGNLLNKRLPDEEIVVVDGNSSDGTKEYLEQLLADGKIHQLLSEPDQSQAHGWNKAMLLANGIIIKKIIDDDIFDYDAIRKCTDYMLKNPDIDVVISNDLLSSLSNYKNIQKTTRLPQFNKWKNKLQPSFTFGDVHLLIRRSSLAYIGLYNTNYVMMDWEYSLRISYLNANIAYYTGYNALSVYHDQSITALKNIKQITNQGSRANVFYEYAGDRAGISLWSKIKIAIGKRIKKKEHKNQYASEVNKDLSVIYTYLQSQIEMINANGDFKFIKKIE